VEEVIQMIPFDSDKSCPKCLHYRLSYTWVEAMSEAQLDQLTETFEPSTEHLDCKCCQCGFTFEMEVYTDESL
jgi:hypothetical protein